MKWTMMTLRILLYLILGTVLLYSPWIPAWTHNFFLARHAWISAAAHNDYVRGAISGIGVVDIWLALEEIRRLRGPARKRGASSSLT